MSSGEIDPSAAILFCSFCDCYPSVLSNRMRNIRLEQRFEQQCPLFHVQQRKKNQFVDSNPSNQDSCDGKDLTGVENVDPSPTDDWMWSTEQRAMNPYRVLNTFFSRSDPGTTRGFTLHLNEKFCSNSHDGFRASSIFPAK